ncbi:hypothetical protein [Bdellovibrio sp. HCB274]|uniref:hypothetical protein n=1 Tax=Bdellovibrio sp. HCB274 TaxID=3394361 RepID=UPI0039B6E5AB
MKWWMGVLCLFPVVSGAEVYGFKTLDPQQYKVDQKSQIEIDNVPPLLSQDTLGVCYAVAASTLLTAENCRSLKKDCKSISSDQVFSPLGLAHWGRPEEDGSKKASQSSKDAVDPYGGNIAITLWELVEGGSVSPSEQCLSLDKILSRIGGAQEASEIQLGIWKKMKALYDKSKSLPKDCDECLSDFYATAKTEIEENLNLNLSNDAMLKAFGKKTYAEFFDRILISPECNKLSKALSVEFTDKIESKYYPEGQKIGNYKESIGLIKRVLNEKRPLGLGNICLDAKPSKKKCENMHAVVIAGYRKTCNSKGSCVDSIKILNSWGKSWQSKNDDGWVDAKTVLDRTFYTEATLSWIGDKK